jgi:hypothetical protein
MFGNLELISPVSQNFVWTAEYVDGTCLSEFDSVTQEENHFHAIRRDELLRFGLFGNGAAMYFDVYGGVFNLLNHVLDISYITDENTYQLTGRPMMYNDIITYKDAEFLFNPLLSGSGQTGITQFNFGYKVRFHSDGIDFTLQAICQIPLNERVRLDLKLVSSKDMNGRLNIKRNGNLVEIIEAPLQRNVGGNVIWELR